MYPNLFVLTLRLLSQNLWFFDLRSGRTDSEKFFPFPFTLSVAIARKGWSEVEGLGERYGNENKHETGWH